MKLLSKSCFLHFRMPLDTRCQHARPGLVPRRHWTRRYFQAAHRRRRLRPARRRRQSSRRTLHPGGSRRPPIQRHPRTRQPQLLSHTSSPTVPPELRNLDWTNPPVNANMVAFGNVVESPAEVAIQAWLYDVRNPNGQAVIGKVYRGTPTDTQVRNFAHQFADEIISKLSGGLPGVASTQIAFVSSRTGTKEIWVMDYDGANQHPLTSPPLHFAHSALVSRRFAHRLHLFRRLQRRRQPANLHVLHGRQLRSSPSRASAAPTARPLGLPTARRLFFPPPCSAILNSSSPTRAAATPNASPLRTACSTSPAWNPKTGQSVVYVSDRGGIPKLYMMNADGTNSTELDVARQRLPDRSRLGSQRTAHGLQLAPPRRQLRHLRHGRRHPPASSKSRATPAATSAPAGLLTAATSSSNPRAVARAKSGPCSPTARKPVSSRPPGHNESPNWSPR